MAQVNTPAPRLPEPPENIDRRYMEDLIRTLQVYNTREKTRGNERN